MDMTNAELELCYDQYLEWTHTEKDPDETQLLGAVIKERGKNWDDPSGINLWVYTDLLRAIAERWKSGRAD